MQAAKCSNDKVYVQIKNINKQESYTKRRVFILVQLTFNITYFQCFLKMFLHLVVKCTLLNYLFCSFRIITVLRKCAASVVDTYCNSS